ncbi:murein L,D-transpeptidase family protein [Lacibacterium aquatile]|uniref:Murein L,D-transpeptidase family protein n=1 Tax=Lacibacterium aquatile TaxID=1168082 RepID=A0ABW5DXA2_9PROT
MGSCNLVDAVLAVLGREAREPLPADARADRILIEKSRHRLTLFWQGAEVRSYSVSVGRGGLEPKRREGDKLTPEGRYFIESRNAASDYHLALKVSYPTELQVAEASAQGWSAGSEIMIHGLRNGFGWIGTWHRRRDWTLGCIAVTDPEIEEIWRVVADGTPVEILP